MKLFSGNFKEEEDKQLKYLYFLRKFRKEQADWFEKIKKLPLKSRTGRNSEKIKKPDLKNGTAIFMKNEKKFEFFWIDSKDNASEITPVEAFEIFEASPNEQTAPLIEKHHQQVIKAMNMFEQTELIAVQAQSDPDAMGRIAKSSKKFLSDILKFAPSDNDKNDIMNIISLIDIGKYTNLPNEIDKLQKKKQKLKLNEQLNEIKLIARKYNVSQAETIKTKKRLIQKSILILSESFE